MSDAIQLLPPGYAMLEPHVEKWAIPTLAGRARRRDESTAEERRSLYEAAKGIAVQALAELDAKPIAAFDEKDRRLMAVLLSYAQVALSIEIRKDGEAEHRKERQHSVITHEPPSFAAIE